MKYISKLDTNSRQTWHVLTIHQKHYRDVCCPVCCKDSVLTVLLCFALQTLQGSKEKQKHGVSKLLCRAVSIYVKGSFTISPDCYSFLPKAKCYGVRTVSLLMNAQRRIHKCILWFIHKLLSSHKYISMHTQMDIGMYKCKINP